MVRQGDIVKLSFNPQKGHEQAGYRPALIISNKVYNQKTKMTILCPISNSDSKFPLHVRLDHRTNTTGYVLCEHVRSMDIEARGYTVSEQIPSDLLEKVIGIVNAEIEIL